MFPTESLVLRCISLVTPGMHRILEPPAHVRPFFGHNSPSSSTHHRVELDQVYAEDGGIMKDARRECGTCPIASRHRAQHASSTCSCFEHTVSFARTQLPKSANYRTPGKPASNLKLLCLTIPVSSAKHTIKSGSMDIYCLDVPMREVQREEAPLFARKSTLAPVHWGVVLR